jgi:tetratricopeptide (TPR) repeat protein
MLLWPMLGYTLSPHEAVRQGNALYQAGEYDAAVRQYATAEQALPEAAEVHFNQGNAAYKRQDYAQALEHYTNALHTAEPILESRTKYNLGNVQYQQALQTMARPQDAMAHARAAITYYRDSLEADPQQLAAQYNLELAYRLVQQLQHHLPAPPQQAQQNSLQPPSPSQRQQEPQDRNPQRRQQAPHSQAQPQNQPQTPPSNQPQTAQEAQASQVQQPSQSHTTSDHSAMRQAARPHQLSPEEAERLLEMIRERAREAERVRAQWQRTKSRDPRVEKDW